MAASRRSSGYLPSLDGWRALAVVGVMMTHDLPWQIAGHSNIGFIGYGGYGVYLFFAISGLLITSRILEEERMHGRFDIRGFYVRRFFRIQPAALMYLATVAVLMAAAVIHETWGHWLPSLLLYQNFMWRGEPSMVDSFYTGHFWSLAVEEHFYILLSLLLFFVRRRRIVILALVYVVLYEAQKIARAHDVFDLTSVRRTYWQLIFLIFPTMTALLLQHRKARALAVRYMPPWAAFTGTAAFLFLFHMLGSWRRGTDTLFSWQLVNMDLITRFFFTLWVMATMIHPRSWTTRLLEAAPLRFIGKLSYSLYLWHVLFFFMKVPALNVTNHVMLALGGRPAKYVATFGAALLSYYFIERPFIRMGHRLAPPATEGRADLDVAALPHVPPAAVS